MYTCMYVTTSGWPIRSPSALTVKQVAHIPHPWCLLRHPGMAQLGHSLSLGTLGFLTGYFFITHFLQCPLPYSSGARPRVPYAFASPSRTCRHICSNTHTVSGERAGRGGGRIAPASQGVVGNADGVGFRSSFLRLPSPSDGRLPTQGRFPFCGGVEGTANFLFRVRRICLVRLA